MTQPNSIQNSRLQELPHDPDHKDRLLGDDEVMLSDSGRLATGIVLRFDEVKLFTVLPDARIKSLGSDLGPWIGWAEVKSLTLIIDENHPQQSRVDMVVRFEHSGQALNVQIYMHTPWVARKSTVRD